MKKASPVPADIAAKLHFNSDGTCCVCQERGKTTQIHHLDGNPENHDPINLAILCFECHNKTQISGGFGRKLTKPVIVKYRDDWYGRVIKRRQDSDRMAVEKTIGEKAGFPPMEQEINFNNYLKAIDPVDFINALPAYKIFLQSLAESGWSSGVDYQMAQASNQYIDSLQGVLVALASYFPPNHFGDKDPHQFFLEQISTRFEWHSALAEPEGPGTGGTLARVTYSSGVLMDVERMVEDMVYSILEEDDRYNRWLKKWSNPQA
ncbi:MAG TPA: HNH endonuclease signature motif containing protein [bacterium]|nr:HNH endonuclease signature motif containing protein [bacterium]